jgi:GntP family gluconate:H+ symporter
MVFAFTFSQYLNESGGVTEFAKALVRKVGPKYDLIALAIVGYILAIPVGLLASCAIVIPMFKPMSKLTGRPIPAYLCAFVVPTLLTACTVVPTSGPVLFAGLLGIDIGFYMVYGILITIPGAIVSTLYAYWLSSKYKKKGMAVDASTEAIDLAADTSKPNAGLIFALILIPIVVITLGSFAPYFCAADSTLYGVLTFVGNPGIAMFIITLISMFALRNYLPRKSTVIFNEGLKEAGPVLVMLGCANVYAGVLTAAGVGDYIVSLLSNSPLNILLVALVLMVALHAGTGAGTVAGSTAITLLMPMFEQQGASLMAFGLICGVGQLVLLIPTDVTFWYMKDASDLSVSDTVKAVCVPSTIAGVVGYLVILILNAFGAGLPGML